MTYEAEIAKQVSYKFECKKDALRQVQDGGVKVTLMINPVDMPPALYGDLMGQRYMAVLVPLNDDETPMEKPKSFAGQAKVLAKDEAFGRYVISLKGGNAYEGEAEQYLKFVCGVESCSEIIDGTEAARKLKQLQAKFIEWRGL